MASSEGAPRAGMAPPSSSASTPSPRRREPRGPGAGPLEEEAMAGSGAGGFPGLAIVQVEGRLSSTRLTPLTMNWMPMARVNRPITLISTLMPTLPSSFTRS